jgi:hypothetical protein
MRCSEVGLQTQEMLANNRTTAVKPTAFDKQFIGPHRGHPRSVSLADDTQTRATPGQQHGRSYRRFANSGRSGPTTRSVLPTIRKLGPLRASNTVESVHYLWTPDDSKRRESGSISCGNPWPLPVVLAGRSEILHSRHPELRFRNPQTTLRCSDPSPQSQTVETQLSNQRRSINDSFEPQQGHTRITRSVVPTIRTMRKRFPVATPGHSQSYWRVGQRSCTLDTRLSDPLNNAAML